MEVVEEEEEEEKKKQRNICGMQAVMSPWNNFSMIKWVAPAIFFQRWQYLKRVDTPPNPEKKFVWSF